MSCKEIISEAIAMPIAEQITLAQALWQNLDQGLIEVNDQAAILECIQRDKEMTEEKVVVRTHAEVIQAARHAIQCA